MRAESLNFLRQLIAAPSPSGYEQPAQRVFRSYIEPFAEAKTDVLGNVIGLVRGTGTEELPRVMLVGHSDEIGFQIKYIEDRGFLYFGAIGGVDPHIVPGQRVLVHGRNGTIPGVVGKKPIHLMEAKDRETVVKLDSQYIDIGVGSKKEAEGLVRVGDPVTFSVELLELEGDRVTARGFDDKAGSFVVAEVLRRISEEGGLSSDLFGVSSVQEEVGLRGGTTSSYTVNPHVGICVEVDFCTDQPDVEKKHNGEVALGKGPIIPRGANVNPALFELLAETAEREKIPVQFTGIPKATGTDANVMQISRGGVATALVKIPLRYMHTPVEVLSLSDLEQSVNLLVATVRRISKENSFIPV
ncbi:M42 family metallopeptidase [Geobacter sp. DSM 9736]|uniref:M42 family metallopeptidase n=1 Tax=Geobacter sp. DSM 9736 TaxID=1277350 RepID=UPI000B4FDF92|nr:M42 family metallopeptidase [Geobacter sp. DSM 9736]SNB45743.1 endoglucanase [Geobacter sp. DSM 9736]